MSSRREPLLWLQCLAIGAIPLEVLLLRLVLAGADVGPVPSLERLFIWAIGVLIPAFLLWQRSPDWGSLLLVRQPLTGRSPFQRQLSAAQTALPLKVLRAAGTIPLLLILWWIDGSALLVADLSPLHNGSRLGSLLLAAPLLALLLWQWQQLIQAAWLLTRDDSTFSALNPLNDSDLQGSTTSFGLGLLKLEPLNWESPVPASTAPTPTQPATATSGQPEASNASESTDESPGAPEDSTAAETETKNESASTADLDTSPATNHDGDDEDPPAQQLNDDANAEQSKTEPSLKVNENDALLEQSALTVSIEPEQSPEEDHSSDLDRQVAEDDAVPGADTETHDEEAKPSGGKKSDPEEPSEASPGGA